MADVNANIGVQIDTSDALAQLKSLQRQLSQFHTSVAKSSATAAAAQKSLQKNLIGSINSIGAFSAELRTVKTSAESFTNSLEKNKFSMREYFRYAGASTKTFGRLFTSELDTISKVAEDRVKKLQTQYIKLGRDSQGAMKAIAIMPNQLDFSKTSTQLQIAAQKQAIFNQLLKQGSTNLLNFGKNTQWAGRQLMVGFTIPLGILGMRASQTFMDMEKAALKFKKVYGDLLTSPEETKAALDGITELGKQYTKYGVAVADTVALSAEAAAAGFQGLDLQRQTAQATRLSVLGQIEAQQALETTIALQNSFKMSSEDLAGSIDFLNAVENQTVTSLDDITIAIPKVAPVIQQLGGNVKDLAFFLTAMKEGGINASEGANALKSGLAAIINPTTKAKAMLSELGINLTGIVESNKGDIKSTVVDFAKALDTLDPLTRARAIEQLFGKFQFARLSTLFQNVTKDGTQASRVLSLAGSSIEELAGLAEKELGMTAASPMNQFKKAVEDLKLALVPVGEVFLKTVTPIVEFFGNLLSKFAGLSDNTKKVITIITVALAGVGPVLLMTFGLLANGVANIIKLFATLRNGYLRLTGQSQMLGEQTQYMTTEQLEAAAAAHSLNQSHANLKQTFDVEKASLDRLIASYQSAARASAAFAVSNPGAMLPIPGGKRPKKFAVGKPYVVGGSGNKDSEPAMLAPGETVIPAKMSKKYGGLINGMIAGNIPGYELGKFTTNTATSVVASHFDITAPSELSKTIKMVEEELGDFGVSVLRVTKDVEGTDYEVSRATEKLANIGNEKNVDVLAGGRTFGGTTTLGQGSRNQMFNALGIKGEAFTLDSLIEQGNIAEEALKNNSGSVEKYSEELNILVEESKAAKELLTNSNDATGEQIKYMRENSKQAIKEAILADSRLKMDGKRITVEEAEIRATARLAQADKELADLRASGAKKEVVLQKAQQKYVATMLKSGTGEFAVGANKTGGNVLRDVATGRGRNVLRRVGQIAGERKFAYGGRSGAEVKSSIVASFAKTGQDLVTAAKNSLISSARRTLRINSPSKEMDQVGSDAAQGLINGTKKSIPKAKQAGQQLGDAAVVGISQSTIAARSRGELYGGGPIDATAKSIRRQEELKAKRDAAAKKTAAIPGIGSRLKSAGGRVAGAMGGARGMGLSSGLMMASQFVPGKAGQIAGQASGVAFALQGLQMLPGPAKIAAAGFLAVAGTMKLVNYLQEKNRQKMEAFGDAIKNTTEQTDFLADKFGFVAQTNALQRFTNTKIVSAPERAQLESLKNDPEFKKAYGKSISGVSKLSDSQAGAALTFKSAELLSQGLPAETVQQIMTAIQEEAGKTDLNIDFRAIKFDDTGLNKLASQAGAISKKTGAELTKAFSQYEGMFEGKYGAARSNEFTDDAVMQKYSVAVNKAAASVASFSGTLSNLAGAGKITGDQLKKSISTMFSSLGKNVKTSAGQMLIFKTAMSSINKDLGESVSKITNVSDAQAILAAATAGVNTEMIKSAILAITYSDSLNAAADASRKATGVADATADAAAKRGFAGAAAGEARRNLDKLTETALAAAKKMNDAFNNVGKTTGKTGGNKEPKWTLAGELTANITALNNQDLAFRKLTAAGIDAQEALELVKNEQIAAAIAGDGLTSSVLKQVEEFLRLKKAAEDLADSLAPYGEKVKAVLAKEQAMFDLEEEMVRSGYADKIYKDTEALRNEEYALEKVNRQIKAQEEAMAALIDPKEKRIDEISYALEGISFKEDEINEKYDKQSKLLSTITKMNQDLYSIQKKRMSLADALSSGDISAAASIIMDMRAEEASIQASSQQDVLDAARQQELDALGRVALEKESKRLQYEILTIQRSQSTEYQDQAKAIQKNIDAIQASLSEYQQEIANKIAAVNAKLTEDFKRSKSAIESAMKMIDLANVAGFDINSETLITNILDGALDTAEQIKKVLAEAAGIKLPTPGSSTGGGTGDTGGMGDAGTYDGQRKYIGSELLIWNGTAWVTAAKYDADKKKADTEARTPVAGGGMSYPSTGSTTTTPTVTTPTVTVPTGPSKDPSATPEETARERGRVSSAVVTTSIADIIVAANKAATTKPKTASVSTPQGVANKLKAIGFMSSGGMVPKYFANGGFNRGTDTVPAMLTPGEFVVNRRAAAGLGIDTLNKINNGEVLAGSVYNYKVDVTLNGSDINPNDVANAVLTKIKQLESRNIRRQGI